MSLGLLGLFASSTLTLSACTTPQTRVEPDSTMTVSEQSNIDLSTFSDQDQNCPKITADSVKECHEQGGKLQREGMMGCYMCVVQYEDAGKTCDDASDCLGECKAKSQQFLNPDLTHQTGECASNSSAFGCYQTIKKGIPQPAICVD